MQPTIRWGSLPFGAAIAALAALTFVYADVVAGLEPIPGITGRLGLAYAAAAVLLAAGAWMVAQPGSRMPARAVALVLLLWLVTLRAPALATHPLNGGAWVTTFETLALFGAACVLLSGPTTHVPAEVGRVCFGLAAVAFGGLHFVYADYVASVIPAWLPGHYFWAYLTGALHVAAGIAILTRVKGRLAAILYGAMFGSWVPLVHLPRVVHHASSRDEWTSLLIALAMCGASWIVASAFPPIAAGAP